jgi:hypothetical protein
MKEMDVFKDDMAKQVKMEEESKFKPSIALCEVVQGHDYTYL